MRTGPTSVLIVDDEPHVCDVIHEELRRRGFHCHVASLPQQAQKLLTRRRFDLLIADISMPQISGLDLLVYARRHAPACKVILITGVSNQEYLARALMLGAYDYVEKPFKTGQLAEAASRAASDGADIPQLPLRAAAAIQLSEQAKQAALHSVRALAQTVEAKDPFTRRHSEQVTHYATNLAKILLVRPEAIESIRIASLLHDIGKIGVPDRILTKPGKLTEAEFEHIRRHPALGADILANIPLFAREAQLVRHHHETWDGRGYPDGLVGEDVPLGSRIIGVADSMDAMLMARSYKKKYLVEKMLGELARCSGSQFDPQIAAAAVQWSRANSNKLILPGRTGEAA